MYFYKDFDFVKETVHIAFVTLESCWMILVLIWTVLEWLYTAFEPNWISWTILEWEQCEKYLNNFETVLEMIEVSLKLYQAEARKLMEQIWNCTKRDYVWIALRIISTGLKLLRELFTITWEVIWIDLKLFWVVHTFSTNLGVIRAVSIFWQTIWKNSKYNSQNKQI